MAGQPQKTSTGTSVRIYTDAKKLVTKMAEKKAKREKRAVVPDAEIVSDAVNGLYEKEYAGPKV